MYQVRFEVDWQKDYKRQCWQIDMLSMETKFVPMAY
jgi:hypothetical protein